GKLTALANWYSFRVRPLASGGADAPRLMTAIAASLAKRSYRVTLTGIPDEDGSATLIEKAFRKAGWVIAREACDSNHVLTLDGRCYDAYLAARPGKLRTTLKRKSGKLKTRIFTVFENDTW